MMPPWVLASQLVCDKVVKFNQEKSMHPWNVGVVLQYSRKMMNHKSLSRVKAIHLAKMNENKIFLWVLPVALDSTFWIECTPLVYFFWFLPQHWSGPFSFLFSLKSPRRIWLEKSRLEDSQLLLEQALGVFPSFASFHHLQNPWYLGILWQSFA